LASPTFTGTLTCPSLVVNTSVRCNSLVAGYPTTNQVLNLTAGPSSMILDNTSVALNCPVVFNST
jgi:hypothetical protein